MKNLTCQFPRKTPKHGRAVLAMLFLFAILSLLGPNEIRAGQWLPMESGTDGFINRAIWKAALQSFSMTYMVSQAVVSLSQTIIVRFFTTLNTLLRRCRMCRFCSSVLNLLNSFKIRAKTKWLCFNFLCIFCIVLFTIKSRMVGVYRQ